jgi:hypothetical protein
VPGITETKRSTLYGTIIAVCKYTRKIYLFVWAGGITHNSHCVLKRPQGYTPHKMLLNCVHNNQYAYFVTIKTVIYSICGLYCLNIPLCFATKTAALSACTATCLSLLAWHPIKFHSYHNIRNAFVGAQSSPLNFTVPRKDAHASLLQQKAFHASKTHMDGLFVPLRYSTASFKKICVNAETLLDCRIIKEKNISSKKCFDTQLKFE